MAYVWWHVKLCDPLNLLTYYRMDALYVLYQSMYDKALYKSMYTSISAVIILCNPPRAFCARGNEEDCLINEPGELFPLLDSSRIRCLIDCMKKQFCCHKKRFLGSKWPLGELTALPDPPAGLRGPTSKGGKRREGKGEGECLTFTGW